MGAARLSLEITETALLKATPSTVATLEALRDLGVRVVIDDFGTGYFSLSHLRQFPVDVLKIASEFVQVPDTDSKTAALAGAIVAMGRSLDIETVAEGIETAEQAARMRDLGCSYGQGYFFAKPVAAERRRRRRSSPSATCSLPGVPADDLTGRGGRRGPAEPALAIRRSGRSAPAPIDRGQPRLTGRAPRGDCSLRSRRRAGPAPDRRRAPWPAARPATGAGRCAAR